MTDYRLASAVFLCFCASVIEFSTTADLCSTNHNCDDKYHAWALTCGVLSAFLCLIRMFLFHLAKELEAKFDVAISCTVTTLWVFGASFNTGSHGPYHATDNGYFSTWLALFAAAYYAFQSVVLLKPGVAEKSGGHASALSVLLTASLIEMCVAADECDKADDCNARHIWAIVAGVISSLFCAAQLVVNAKQPDSGAITEKFLSLFLLAWWATGAGINTSHKGPFRSSCLNANGYFSTWVAFFSSLAFAYNVFAPDSEDKSSYTSIDGK